MLCCINKVSGNMIHGKMKGCFAKEKVKRSKVDKSQYIITPHFIQIQRFFKSTNVCGQLKPWVMSFALLPFFFLLSFTTIFPMAWSESWIHFNKTIFGRNFTLLFFFYSDKIELWLKPWITSLTPLPLDSQSLVTSDIRPDIRSKQEHYPSISYFPSGRQL